ncbi:TRAP transporter small permease subunit [Desulfobacula sp.]|uniref:TRAP transporter small permease subunit n=1 Tax=Desulfobacula sp. TaxID=2593537 RepID=UPI0025BA2C9D|nr:TRAP transporter small permease subunit [Desulfobacula sp.]MBC2705543.1 TRAP transporter small permease subunit [Desulfobacula sp.]
MLVKIETFFDRFADAMGHLTAVIMIAMLLNVFYDVIMRYLFKTGSIAMQEMEWHLFSLVFLIGISYALFKNGHVRVDIIYDQLSVKKQALINIAGSVIFLIPFSLLIAFGSIDFVLEAFHTGEISGDPGGLTHRWLIKALLPFSFFLLVFSTIGIIVKNINLYQSVHVKSHKEKGA